MEIDEKLTLIQKNITDRIDYNQRELLQELKLVQATFDRDYKLLVFEISEIKKDINQHDSRITEAHLRITKLELSAAKVVGIFLGISGVSGGIGAAVAKALGA